jgi:hypothetical protein
MTHRKLALARCWGILCGVAMGFGADPAAAQSGQSLQEAAQNPIASLISVPSIDVHAAASGQNEGGVESCGGAPEAPTPRCCRT